MTCITSWRKNMSSNNNTPDQESPETPTAVADAAAPEAGEDQRSFGQRGGRKKSGAGARALTSESSMSTRIEAERLYQEIRGMVRQDKRIETGQDVPF